MTDMFVISGGRPLQGSVGVTGAKNSALKLMATALLAEGTTRLTRVPDLADTSTMIEVLTAIGARTSWESAGTLAIDVPGSISHEAPYEPVRRMRASTAVLGPLIARNGKARVAMPGGCNLGRRGLDLHIHGLEMLGCRISTVHGYLEVEAADLKPALIRLDYPSHGATETILMAATAAVGETVIENASKEPEIVDLCDMLRCMGAQVSGDGTDTISIEGGHTLSPCEHSVLADRLQAGTFMLAALGCGGDVTVTGCEPEHLTILVEDLTACGADVMCGGNQVRVCMDARPAPIDVSTLPYPGFPTDLQSPLTAALTCASGRSIITENIFDGRFMVIDELTRMGANVHAENRFVVIDGVERLSGAPVVAPDLRSGAALVIAGLMADGQTTVEGLSHIDRGYDAFDEKLRSLGAAIERVSTSSVATA